MIKFSTLSSRLTFWYSAVFALVMGLIFFIFYLLFDATLQSRLDEDLTEDIEEFQRILADEGVEGVEAELLRDAKELNDAENEFVRLLNVDGDVLHTSNLEYWQGLATDIELFNLAKAEEVILHTVELASREEPTRAVYGKINDQLIIHLGESLEEKNELLELLSIIALAMFLLGIPLAATIGWLMSRKAVKGINQVRKIAQEIEQGSLDKRVSGEMWGDEIAQLAATFNAMLDRIHELILEMRELTDNVAHDLRSPLTRIRVISESALSHHQTEDEFRHSAADVIEECDRLMQMINATLDLAELEAGAANIKKDKLDLTELVEDACELFQPLAEEKKIELQVQNGRPHWIVGDVQNLQRMLSNLLDNAIKYTPESGVVKVEIVPNGQTVELIVSDTGIGIPEEEQRRVFERFYRCDQNRLQSGCGLGLSFARAVVRAHGGNISLSSQIGKGSTFRVSLNAFDAIGAH